MITYSPTSAFWMCNRVANACYKMYNEMAPVVVEKIDAWEKGQMEKVKETDSRAMEIYNEAKTTPRRQIRRNASAKKVVDPYADVKQFLTEYSVNTAQDIFNQWVNLETLLLVKFIDGNNKAQNADGSFVTNKYTDKIPDNIKSVGYTEKWKECVAKDHGETVRVP